MKLEEKYELVVATTLEEFELIGRGLQLLLLQELQREPTRHNDRINAIINLASDINKVKKEYKEDDK